MTSDSAMTTAQFRPIAPSEKPVLPDYSGACISNIVPAFFAHPSIGEGWIPQQALEAKQVMLLVIDGLGWNQLCERIERLPNFAKAQAIPITSIAPTTTSAALTSITTGCPPAEHGITGYTMDLGGEVLNTLSWRVAGRSVADRITGRSLLEVEPFCTFEPPVISNAMHAKSQLSAIHFQDCEYRGYYTSAHMLQLCETAFNEGHRFSYAYIDNLDKIGHATGHGAAFEAEFDFFDALIGQFLAKKPAEAALIVTADHGQIDCTDRWEYLDHRVESRIDYVSGEPRFLWLHCGEQNAADLCEVAREIYGERCWVYSRDEAINTGMFGAVMNPEIAARYGQVALIAKEPLCLMSKKSKHGVEKAMHGSLSSDETYVPLLTWI